MNRSLVAYVMLLLVSVSTGCAPEAAKKAAGDMGKGMADTAKVAAGEMAQATGMSDMLGKATEALSSVEGGSDMLKSVSESFGKLTETFKGVTDADSATAALPDLGKLTESFGGMTAMFDKLPSAAKSAVSGVFTSALGELKPLVDKVMAIPGVGAIIKPAVDTLMSKFDAFKA